MNVTDSTASTYLNMVQQASKRNTLSHVAEARQSGTAVDVEQLKSSNQQLREDSRELGVELYSQNLKKQQFETYVNSAPDYGSSNSSSNNSSNNNNNDDSSSVYTFDAARVNDNLQMAQRRTLGVAFYENMNAQNQPGSGTPSTLPVNVSV